MPNRALSVVDIRVPSFFGCAAYGIAMAQGSKRGFIH